MKNVDPQASPALQRRQRYWAMARRLTLGLLFAWFAITFGALFFARELSGFTVFGWPLSFYMAAQGLTLFYLLLVAVYVAVMRYLDHAVEEKDDD